MFIDVNACMNGKIEAHKCELLSGAYGFSHIAYTLKNGAILPQSTIHIPYNSIAFFVLLMMVARATMIITEFFIAPSADLFSANRTMIMSVFCCHMIS